MASWTLLKRHFKHHQILILQRLFRTQCCLLTRKLSSPVVLVYNRIPKACFYNFPISGIGFTSVYYNPLVISSRNKSRRTHPDSNDETGSDSDMDDNLDEDDFEASSHFKVMTVHAPSLRTDAVLSNSLNISRHRLEELFFASCVLLNGANLTKKGLKMNEGDYVDVIMEKIADQIKVKRVKLLKISPQKTGTDKFILKIRVWKAPFTLYTS